MRLALHSAALLVCLSAAADCEQLPIRVYTTAEGLGHNSVHRIVADSRGFLWFATGEGLSRFDGYQFRTYGIDEGLPHRAVYDLLEARNGIYWIATPAGLSRFDPRARPTFRTYLPSGPAAAHWVNTIREDGEGGLWCGTKDGLYHFDTVLGAFTRIEFISPHDSGEDTSVRDLLKDRVGDLWVAAGSGLYRRRGQVWERFTTVHGLPTNDILSLLQDSQGRLWAGTAKGLCQIAPDPTLSVKQILQMNDGLPGDYVQCLHEQDDGGLWIGTPSGLGELSPDALSPHVYTTRQGLSSSNIEALRQDREGNLWIGTDGGGAMRSARDGFVTFTSADGLAPGTFVSIQQSHGGELSVTTRDGGALFLNHLQSDRFVATRLNLPRVTSDMGWGWGQIITEDGNGRLWAATGRGPAVFPKTNNIEALRRVAVQEIPAFRGPNASNVFRLFADSHGTVWISTSAAENNGLATFDKDANTFREYSADDGLNRSGLALWGALAEDHSGAVWIGSLQTTELARYAKGRFSVFKSADGLPAGEIRWLYPDRAGRLWAASGGSGLIRVDDPESGHPHFVTYSTAQGLSSNFTTSITEDRWGRVYVSTGKGVDRLDPVSGRVRHFTAADGLVRGELQFGFGDRQGRVWFGGPAGVSRLTPEPDRPQPPPPVLITGVQIAGSPYAIAATGQLDVSGAELQPDQSQLRLEFAGIGFGDALRYQFKLNGRDWSTPTDQRSVEYAQLSPGTYRFLVRALTSDGLQSAQPASVSFTVIAPIWRRWWFLALAAMAGGLLVSAAHRYRTEHLLELERVRTRVATDLHDDLGSSLSYIAIQSEVAGRQNDGDRGTQRKALSEIATTARDLVDSLSDIVWAINPENDRLSDLVRRMRWFGGEVFQARNVRFQLTGPAQHEDLVVRADLRREIFLVFKEAVNNSVRHSHCREVRADLVVQDGFLVLTIADDGTGFDPGGSGNGLGLKSLRERAKRMGGSVEIASRPNEGVTITLRVPGGGPRSGWKKYLHKGIGVRGRDSV